MEVVRGYNGQAVQIMNLPGVALQNYTQFKSVSHQHASGRHLEALGHQRLHVEDGGREQTLIATINAELAEHAEKNN